MTFSGRIAASRSTFQPSWKSSLQTSSEDIVREERLVSDNAQILARLDEEEAELLEILADSGRHAEEMREAFEAAAAKLTESEAVFTALTAERAEAAAGRQQLEKAIRSAQLPEVIPTRC